MKYSEKRERIKNATEPWLYLAPFLVFFFVFIFYPAINVLLLSFKENYSHLRGTFTRFSMENYKAILADPKFRSAMTNTVLYVIFVVPISTFISILAAHLLNQKIRGIAFFQTAFFMPMVTSVTAVGLVWRFMYNQKYGVFNFLLGKIGLAPIGWTDESKWSLLAMVIFGIWNILPFTIILLMAGMQNIDEKYYLAAKIDGAKPLKIFTRITIPMLAPTILLVLIVNTISCFKVFSELYPLFNGKPGPYYNFYTVVYYIRYAMVEKRKYGYAAAAAMIFFLVVLIFTFFQLRLKNKMQTRGLK